MRRIRIQMHAACNSQCATIHPASHRIGIDIVYKYNIHASCSSTIDEWMVPSIRQNLEAGKAFKIDKFNINICDLVVLLLNTIWLGKDMHTVHTREQNALKQKAKGNSNLILGTYIYVFGEEKNAKLQNV